MNYNYWPQPKYRGIGFYSDASMYIDVLKFGSEVDFFSKTEIEILLSNRVKGLSFNSTLSKTAYKNLLFELKEFKWIKYYYSDSYQDDDFNHDFINKEVYKITFVGKQVLNSFYEDYRTFYNALIKELNTLYTIPSWFIQRLWDLNGNQGQVIIPVPSKSWNPQKRKWADRDWKEEIEVVVSQTSQYIKSILPDAFPYPEELFIKHTKERWLELGNSKPKFSKETNTEFTPRKRLSQSMREATINYFFGNYNLRSQENDFSGVKSPLLPRTYSYWCARLEELGLINYTDYNPQIPGRIIYPVSVFKDVISDINLTEIKYVNNIAGYNLALFQPSLENSDFVSLYTTTLYEEYHKLYLVKKSIYVSIQDVRDEVCRLLKLSSSLFNIFLQHVIFLTDNDEEIRYRISLETDIREDQKGGSQRLRKPVYVNKKIVTLIAITKS